MIKSTLTISSTVGHPIDVHVYRSERDERTEFWYVVDNTATVHLGRGDLASIESYSDFQETDMFTAESKINTVEELAEAVEQYLDILESEE